MNKKGESMVEAALIFPLTILALIALVYIMAGMYGNAAMNAKTHTELRAYAEDKSGIAHSASERVSPSDKIAAKALSSGRAISEEGLLLWRKASAVSSREIRGGALLKDASVSYASDSSVYIIDETEYMRWADLAKEKENTEIKGEK